MRLKIANNANVVSTHVNGPDALPIGTIVIQILDSDVINQEKTKFGPDFAFNIDHTCVESENGELFFVPDGDLEIVE